tara:strand:- start:444 stop:644 length:201 start_codon:yes stop_codon:yes gene_type:complete
MRKPEIQPLSPLILRTSNIILLLLNRHRIPDSVPLLVATDVVCFDEVEEHNIEAADAEEDLIASDI